MRSSDAGVEYSLRTETILYLFINKVNTVKHVSKDRDIFNLTSHTLRHKHTHSDKYTNTCTGTQRAQHGVRYVGRRPKSQQLTNQTRRQAGHVI